VCNQLVGAGVRSILNFAPVVLQVPQEVEVRKVDLAVEMQILSFHVARRHGEPALNGAASGSAHGTPILSKPVDETAGGSVNGSVNSSVLRDSAVSRDGLVGRAVMP
jgi:redox-sensing transcriptional repressor